MFDICLMTFLKREIGVIGENRLEFPSGTSSRRRPRAGASSPDIDQPFGANAAVAGQRLEERDLREVSAYSTVYPGFACRTAYPHCPG
jgi:hypothetical protein